MGFVNGDQRRLALGQHLAEARHAQPLRRNEEELQAAIQVIHASLPRLRPVEAGVNPPHPQAERQELGRLILHQRNQRADDQSRSAQRNRRQLVAERLAKAGRHHQQQVAPRNGRAADRLLIGAEARKAEDRAQQLVQLNRFDRRIRIGWSRQWKMVEARRITAQEARSASFQLYRKWKDERFEMILAEYESTD